MPYRTTQEKDAAIDRLIDRMLERVSEANRPWATAWVRRRRNRRIKRSSIYNSLAAVLRCDGLLNGQPFATVSAQDLEILMENIRLLPGRHGRPLGGNQVRQTAIHLKAALKDVLLVRELPVDIERALQVDRSEPEMKGNVITGAQFDRMLAVAVDHGPYSTSLRPMLDTVVLEVLRDSATRCEELCSPNIGDLVFNPRTHGAELNLNPDTGCYLKTGPRPIPLYQSVRALRRWLEVHPAKDDPKAPLFIGLQDKTGYERLSDDGVRRIVKRAANLAGVNKELPRGDNLTPHDLRHTRLTELAKTLTEEPLRMFAGWAPGSRMAAVYLHFSRQDVDAEVRKEYMARQPPVVHARQAGAVPSVHSAVADALAMLSQSLKANPSN